MWGAVGFRASGVWGSGFRVSGLVGLGFRAFGFRVSGLKFEARGGGCPGVSRRKPDGTESGKMKTNVFGYIGLKVYVGPAKGLGSELRVRI